MKKIFLSGIAMLLVSVTFAQNALDALPFSTYNPNGSARIQAIGGSNVSLGGDISSTYINPAGLAQYKTNEWVFTPGFLLNRTNMKYADSAFKEKRNAFGLGANGVILSWGNRFSSSSIKNTTISLVINQTANFNSDFRYSGKNGYTSFSEKWVDQLVDNRVDDFGNALNNYPDGASLAVENYLVDTILSNGNIVGYRSNAQPRSGMNLLNQQFVYQTRGGIYEPAFGLALNQNEKILYGISFGLPIVNYRKNTTVIEEDATGNTDNDFASFNYTERFTTSGVGINARLGVIFKPVEYFRIGLTFHTPTVYSLTDKTFSSLTADVENFARRISGNNSKPSEFTLNTHDITGGEDYSYNYQLATPWRFAVSLAYVFREIKDVTKQKAFITGDLELVNYKAFSYSSNEEQPSQNEIDYFKSVNRNIDDIYKMALNARIGGELKFKTLMVRGGFQYIGSPLKKSFYEGVKTYSMIPSFGLGYRDKGVFVDLTYTHTIGRGAHVPYFLTQVSGEDRPSPLAKNNFTNGQIVATIGFKF